MTDTAGPTVPDDIHTDTHPDEDGDETSIYVSVGIQAGGVSSNANRVLLGDFSDVAVARSVIEVASACAALHGSGVWMELQRQLAEHGSAD